MNHALGATGLALNLAATVMLVFLPARPLKSLRDWRTNHRALTPFALLILGSLMIVADLLLT